MSPHSSCSKIPFTEAGRTAEFDPPKTQARNSPPIGLPPAASGFTMRYREGGVDRVSLAVLFPGGRGRCE